MRAVPRGNADAEQHARKLAPKGVEVVGVALDNKEEVGAFVRQLKISYPILLGDSDTLGLMRSLGNATGGLPYTLVLHRKGKVAAKLIGRLDEKKLEAAIKPYSDDNARPWPGVIERSPR